jgi:probable phosphoglycerate mutase
MNTIYWVRHGENKANLTKELSHRLVDYPLTAKGRMQAAQTAAWFSSLPVKAVYTSPLLRAVETAQAIAGMLGLPVRIEENFREINVGDLEKNPGSRESWAENERIFRSWVGGSLETSFPGGENFLQLLERTRRGYLRVLSEFPGQTVVIVAHGGNFITSLRAFCPDVELAWLLANESHNCSITRLEMEAIGEIVSGRLLEWGFAGHLSGEAANLVSGIFREEEPLPPGIIEES